MISFEDLVYLFANGVETRGIVRLDLDEAAMLYKFAKQCKGDVVEIGRKYGGSALLLASALEGDSKVYSVDIVRYPQLESNLSNSPQEVSNRIEIIEGESAKIGASWDKPIDLLFVDGDHSYESVETDARLWCPHVNQGGIAAFHDVRDTYLGLEPIVDHLKHSGDWVEELAVDTLVFLRRV